jgi:hypothetical protein
VEELNRILNRQDMRARGLIDMPHDGRECGRLARAGDSRDQDQPALVFGHGGHHRRQSQRLDGRDIERDGPQHQREVALLPEDVAAEPAHVLDGVAGVPVAQVVEVPFVARAGEDELRDALRVLRDQRRDLDRQERPIDSQGGRRAGFQVDIRRAVLHGGREELIERSLLHLD